MPLLRANRLPKALKIEIIEAISNDPDVRGAIRAIVAEELDAVVDPPKDETKDPEPQPVEPVEPTPPDPDPAPEPQPVA